MLRSIPSRVTATFTLRRVRSLATRVANVPPLPLPRLPERAMLVLGAAILGFIDPGRGDAVASLGELSGGCILARMRDRMELEHDGARILVERPRLRSGAAALAALHDCPVGSFGEAYACYLNAHGFSPDARHEVRFIADDELRYVLQRYREVHDLWHVLSGLPPTLFGEIALKHLEAAQTGLPSATLSAFVAPLRLTHADRIALLTVYIPWARRTAREARYLMAVPYEELLCRPLADVRAALRVTPAPEYAIAH